MMGVNEVVTDQEKEKETVEQARNRFLLNYLSLVAQPDMEWFDQHVPSLLRIAVPVPRPAHPRPVRVKLKPHPVPEDNELVPWGKLPEYYLEDEYKLVQAQAAELASV